MINQILQDKQILITGLLSERSIAYGVAKQCYTYGAKLAFTYQSERFKDRVAKLAQDFNSDLLFPCDVTKEDEVKDLFVNLGNKWSGLDGVLHSIAYSPKEGLSGNFIDNVTHDVYSLSNQITAYSFCLLAKYACNMLKANHGSMVTLTYIGSNCVVPNYNMAGVAKASLESIMRYMAYTLGSDDIRVNAVSAGPIKTLAASGITGFSKILDHVAKTAPLKRNITSTEVGDSVAFLFSHLARGITGEILFVDAGYNIMSTNLTQ